MRLKPARELRKEVCFWVRSLFKMVRACHSVGRAGSSPRPGGGGFHHF